AKRRNMTGLDAFIQAIGSVLEQDGLAGWIGCRCAVSLLETLIEDQDSANILVEGERIGVFHKVGKRQLFRIALERRVAWKQVHKQLTPFYREGIPHDLDRGS